MDWPEPPAEAGEWFRHRTWQEPRWPVEELVRAKAGRRVSVVLPAMDEQATVGDVVRSITPLACGPDPLVDDLVVVDSGSVDDTRAVAERAGARVVSREAALPGTPVRPGKGEVLWRALGATDGDVIVFVDADLCDPSPSYVPALLGPILHHPGVALVKGYYRRPIRVGGDERPTGGGRVTELVARPMLASLFPELCEVVQPLGGEYAAERGLLESVGFAAGYGVEIGLLVDTVRARGLEALAQVNLGVRRHRNRELPELALMSRQIVAALVERAGLVDSGAPLVRFLPGEGGWWPQARPVELRPRPSVASPEPSRPAENEELRTG